ncbi:MAG: hypothetical protein QXF61_03050 [Nitrososphaeria archaeon]
MSLESKLKIITLKEWQEVVGLFEGGSSKGNPILKIGEQRLEVNTSGFLLSEQLKINTLSSGELIGIIRTDDYEQPFRVRIIKRQTCSILNNGGRHDAT